MVHTIWFDFKNLKPHLPPKLGLIRPQIHCLGSKSNAQYPGLLNVRRQYELQMSSNVAVFRMPLAHNFCAF